MLSNKKAVFKNPEAVREQMDLPAVINYSFVGDSSPVYHAKVEEIVVRIAGEQNIRKRSFRESAQGNYTAYRFEVFHDTFGDIEDIYREVIALEGTRFVI
jgi:putative lipoic acid-binding regulatory protein